MEALIRIQKELKAPKDTTVSMGQYSYQCRSAEGIYALVKPLLQKATLVLTDQVKDIGTRFYIGSTATIKEGELSESSTAWAREQETQRGLNAAQVTAICSSMARKYALQGLFLLDDGKDADTLPQQPETPTGPAPWTPTRGPASSTNFATTLSGEPFPTGGPAKIAGQPKVKCVLPANRPWLKALFDYYVSQSDGRLQAEDTKPMHTMLKLIWDRVGHLPTTMADIEFIKQPQHPEAAIIKVEELCA